MGHLNGSAIRSRCTGAALSVALGLVEATCPQSSAGSLGPCGLKRLCRQPLRRLHCEAMALHLLRRVTHAGMDELANWTAKTHKFAFQNSSGGPVRILLEEDPDGAPSILEI